jgi:hypothetical protein
MTRVKDYRSAIEHELADRLAHRQPTPSVPVEPSVSPVTAAVPVVSLLCLKCRAISAGDAHFCTSCGERFNALVIARQ